MAIQEFLSKYLSVVFVDILVVFGALKILGWLYRILKTFLRNCCRPCCQKKGRLYKLYGNNAGSAMNPNSSVHTEISLQQLEGSSSNSPAWAVVTGGSDGIGLAIAKKLAREGFNICVISRTESKINQKLEEIRKECRDGDSTFETLCVVADFSKMHTIEDYEQTIGSKLKDHSIGMLVLNAGYVQNGPFDMLYNSEVEMHFTLNVLHVVYTTKVLLPQLLERFEKTGKKSGLAIVSSIMATLPISGVSSYCCSKICVTYFGRAMAGELDGKVDVIAYEPGGVATKLIGD